MTIHISEIKEYWEKHGTENFSPKVNKIMNSHKKYFEYFDLLKSFQLKENDTFYFPKYYYLDTDNELTPESIITINKIGNIKTNWSWNYYSLIDFTVKNPNEKEYKHTQNAINFNWLFAKHRENFPGIWWPLKALLEEQTSENTYNIDLHTINTFLKENQELTFNQIDLLMELDEKINRAEIPDFLFKDWIFSDLSFNQLILLSNKGKLEKLKSELSSYRLNKIVNLHQYIVNDYMLHGTLISSDEEQLTSSE